ncbi:threonine/serine dehydratase [Asticcacaulis sp.]|uniref:threonine ammonia-lyase n=1 Tax=Asticcacaulis sp. TaxID=1872648 RepID=UPI0026277FC4|nr:pyridoxal-phosphate dependent enzyme [Asticcacaulis sp.]
MRYPDPDGIKAALDRIDPAFRGSPIRQSATLDRMFGAELWFKDETANPIRSFKARGACNFMAALGDDDRPLVCGSAGNFGQGLAWAARLHGRRLTVFAAANAVRTKIQAMRDLGADVRLHGADFDAAKAAALCFAAEKGHRAVADGDEVLIAEGAGTIALEAMEAVPGIDRVLAPLGNGALASGIGTWVRHAAPAARMLAVAAAGAPVMAHAIRGLPVTGGEGADTIADGIAVRVPIPYAVNSLRRVLDGTILVPDAAILRAMELLRSHLDLVVEPAGAAGLAALLSDPAAWGGRRILIPLCGGNIDAA